MLQSKAQKNFLPGKYPNLRSFDKLCYKVGAGEECDLAACIFEVGRNGVFLVTFILGDEDVAKYVGAGGGRDAEDDVR